MQRASAIYTVLLLLGLAGPAAADLCSDAAARVAPRYGVPVAVLTSVAKAETGRTRGGALQPWAWTINHAGTGQWFDDSAAALGRARQLIAQGETNFDSGCFQINWRWHGTAFSDVSELFDPSRSAAYAAEFLRQLYDELGSWSAAAGAYHSRTPELAARYRQRFDQILASEGGAPASRPARPARINSYPLLQSSGGARGLGSLVPGRS
ncbi:transglycosylase SLT domain-containing protein [Ketogulonicigenium robustum]|uniref:transglycosylase SLT domain-containing protein n=1 Tax=Ketogulonicigenium robustum TaxID=92947 RepID=UPI001F187A80|nr:transglycosylase SLT domain-containing protein [Ketogulonicigenium robustum]